MAEEMRQSPRGPERPQFEKGNRVTLRKSLRRDTDPQKLGPFSSDTIYQVLEVDAETKQAYIGSAEIAEEDREQFSGEEWLLNPDEVEKKYGVVGIFSLSALEMVPFE